MMVGPARFEQMRHVVNAGVQLPSGSVLCARFAMSGTDIQGNVQTAHKSTSTVGREAASVTEVGWATRVQCMHAVSGTYVGYHTAKQKGGNPASLVHQSVLNRWFLVFGFDL